MPIDNSAAKLFRFCPDAYKERVLIGIEKKLAFDAPNHLAFGTRIHSLLEDYYRTLKGEVVLPTIPTCDEDTEREAQEMFAGYRAHYPVESFSVVDVERTFKVEIAPGVWYTGKIDLAYEEDERLGIMDHKSEKRGGKGNLPQAWAARDQVSLYKRAAEILYNRPVHNITINVLTRSSPKGQEPPSFRRDPLQRTEDQVQKAVDDLVYVSKLIADCTYVYGDEQGDHAGNVATWPQNRENCHNGMWGCEYYSLHIFGRSEETLSQYQPTKPYLDL